MFTYVWVIFGIAGGQSIIIYHPWFCFPEELRLPSSGFTKTGVLCAEPARMENICGCHESSGYHNVRMNGIVQQNYWLPSGKLTGRAALGQLVFLTPFVLCVLCSFVLAPLSASVASFGQLFEKVQWNIPRQINLSCLNIKVYICIYVYNIYIYYFILYYIIFYYIVLYYIILYHIIPYHIILYYIIFMLYYIISYYMIFYYIILIKYRYYIYILLYYITLYFILCIYIYIILNIDIIYIYTYMCYIYIYMRVCT